VSGVKKIKRNEPRVDFRPLLKGGCERLGIELERVAVDRLFIYY
jgi:hypothetical protein